MIFVYIENSRTSLIYALKIGTPSYCETTPSSGKMFERQGNTQISMGSDEDVDVHTQRMFFVCYETTLQY